MLKTITLSTLVLAMSLNLGCAGRSMDQIMDLADMSLCLGRAMLEDAREVSDKVTGTFTKTETEHASLSELCNQAPVVSAPPSQKEPSGSPE